MVPRQLFSPNEDDTMRFMQGDKVSYTGKKFAQDLHGKLGEIAGRVEGTATGVVVDFGGESYIMDEAKHLTTFQGHLKGDREDRKDTKVERRRPKRQQKQQEDEE